MKAIDVCVCVRVLCVCVCQMGCKGQLIVSVGVLGRSLRWVEECFQGQSCTRVASREAVWSKYHKALPAHMPAMIEATSHRQAAAIMALETMKELVCLRFPAPSFPVASEASVQQISPDECDILHYIAGYLLHKSGSKFNEAQLLSNTGDKGSDLVQAIDRGGLIRPDAAFVDFVLKMEAVFRSMPDVSVNQSGFRSKLADNGIPAIFHDVVQDVSTCNESDQKFYDFVTTLFFKVRVHKKCKDFLAQHRVTRTVRSKALRDSLPN